jgi:hypothetical protein
MVISTQDGEPRQHSWQSDMIWRRAWWLAQRMQRVKLIVVIGDRDRQPTSGPKASKKVLGAVVTA